MYYTPARAVSYSPGAVKWLLRHYWLLHQGIWPPKPGVEGYESDGFIPGGSRSYQAPHEVASGIAGELMWRLSTQGPSGLALFLTYALNWDEYKVGKFLGWSSQGVLSRMGVAIRQIGSAKLLAQDLTDPNLMS